MNFNLDDHFYFSSGSCRESLNSLLIQILQLHKKIGKQNVLSPY